MRLPGAWEAKAIERARSYLRASTLVRRGPAEGGPRVYQKSFNTPSGHTHPLERTVAPTSCTLPLVTPPGTFEVSDIDANAVPYATQLPGCPGASPTTWTPQQKQQEDEARRRGKRRWGRG